MLTLRCKRQASHCAHRVIVSRAQPALRRRRRWRLRCFRLPIRSARRSAASASALFEATPFLFAGVLLARLLRRSRTLVEYLGCGCGRGPSARSLPAAAATWLVFGPFVAVARYAGGICSSRGLDRADAHCMKSRRRRLANLLRRTVPVLPAALVAGACDASSASASILRVSRRLAARCSAPHSDLPRRPADSAPSRSPARCAFALLWLRRRFSASPESSICAPCGATPAAADSHDAFAYALLAPRSRIVAWRHGDALVHPAFARRAGVLRVRRTPLRGRHRGAATLARRDGAGAVTDARRSAGRARRRRSITQRKRRWQISSRASI